MEASSTTNRNLRVDGFIYNQKRVGKKWTLYWCRNARWSNCSATVRLHNNGHVEKQGQHCTSCMSGPLSDISNTTSKTTSNADQDENSVVNNNTSKKSDEDNMDVSVSMKIKAEHMALSDMSERPKHIWEKTLQGNGWHALGVEGYEQ